MNSFSEAREEHNYDSYMMKKEPDLHSFSFLFYLKKEKITFNFFPEFFSM